jgi:DNA-binding NtrC family response regulator
MNTNTKPVVLVVDDDPETLLLVTTMVEYLNYQPMTASTWAGTKHVLAQKPSIIILDLVMPDMASQHLLDKLATENDKTPVILMSGALASHLEIRVKSETQRGINIIGQLPKPFWIESLHQTLEKAIST